MTGGPAALLLGSCMAFVSAPIGGEARGVGVESAARCGAAVARRHVEADRHLQELVRRHYEVASAPGGRFRAVFVRETAGATGGSHTAGVAVRLPSAGFAGKGVEP
jgi:hypothetical protein